MADNTIANAIKFLKGEEKSLPAAKTEGQVYFAYKNVGTAEKPSYTGAIYIDTPIGGTQNRIKMTANADIADKAFNDSAGLNIRDTYLSSLGYTDDGKQTILIKGSGNNQARIALPIASTTKSGIVTTDAQSFGGTKTFTTINSTNLTITGTSGFNYSGIETATESKARPIWFADSSINGKPVINTNFTYNPATQTLSVANLSGTADKANKDNAGNDIRSTYINNITVNGTTLTFTKGSGVTSNITLQDNNNAVTQTAIKSSDYTNWRTVLWGASNSATEGFAPTTVTDGTFTSDTLTFQPSSGTLKAKVFKGSLLGNASTATSATKATYDSSGTKDIRSYVSDVTISGRTITVTKGSGAKVTLTTQDTDTWRGIQNNLTSDSTTDSLSAAQGKYLKSLIDGKSNNGHNHDDRYYTETEINNKLANYLPLSGGTLTGALNFANNIWNVVGDDVAIGDMNIAGTLGVMGKNGNTAIKLVQFGASTTSGDAAPGVAWTCTGNGTSTISGILSGTFSGNLSGNAASANKLNTNAGSSTRPVYFSGGVPVQCNDTLANSISGKSASTDAINWVAGNEIRFTKPNFTEPQTLHIAWAWADGSKSNLINDYRFNNGNGLDLAQVTASQFNGNLNGNATGLTDAIGGSNTIKIGWNGDGLTSSKIHSLAAYSTDAVLIKDAPKSAVREWLGPMPASDVYAWAKASSKPTYSWGEITGKPSTFTPSSHTHYSLSTIGDQRSTATTPDSYSNTFVFQGLKNNSTIGITTSANAYSYVLGLRGWKDSSGGDSHELAFNGNLGILTRSGATTWNAWRRILDSSNYTEYTVTKSGSGASGTWGINVTGSAGSVAWGNISGKPSSFNPASHTHSYLPLAGGTMSGTSFITWPDSGNWSNNNNNVTFPVSRGGLQWNGQSDYIKLFSQETGIDNLELVLQFGDDNSNGLSIRNSTGTQTARIAANGNITASSFIGNLSGNAATATKLQTARTISLTGSVTGSGIFDGSGNLSITTSTNHSHSQYLPLAGGTMTGTINFNGDTLACNFRSNNGNLASGIMHQTYGTEALVFATTNTATSFIFKCGQKPTSMTNNTWTNITPSMMIKNQSVYINYSVANGAAPMYNFCVNGTTRCRGTLGVGDGSSAEIDFFPNSASTIGARIKAYSDRIEFVFS